MLLLIWWLVFFVVVFPSPFLLKYILIIMKGRCSFCVCISVVHFVPNKLFCFDSGNSEEECRTSGAQFQEIWLKFLTLNSEQSSAHWVLSTGIAPLILRELHDVVTIVCQLRIY